ncbi:Peptidase Do [Lentibacillus sp. JNUCC-1]|uniref:S1C family serine protease n=1 Tax=Lentibacillus sp. JNUCC-1 TaxID=2654513 RepID=UPI0012E722D7|nr:S1C family serine protease [Lentibacillus sp. JNUCC-1]MUV36298.1 Peptidase Do [Lentibacillus sp. JNUCC-1]
MLKKHQGPFITSLLIILGGAFTIYVIYQFWNSQELVVDSPAVSLVNEENAGPDLTSIVHEAEKNVMLIEGRSEDDTITGSGFLYNESGDIVTNAHVVRDADLIYVRTANARIYPGALVGISDETDIAVIRVPQLAGQVHLDLEEEKAEIGDEVIALGSPHGFQNTVTLGIISGTERNFSVDGYDYQNVYQISAQITHGNSGGPLISRESGKVMGINSVGTEDGTLGFSIPIDDVLPQLKQWSNEAKNDQLDFASTDDLLQKADPEQLITDTEYLLDYFFDSLRMRDYVGAYTILGSDIQKETSYPDFRQDYMQAAEISITNKHFEVIGNNKVKAKADVDISNKLPKEDELTTNRFTYEFVIGYENEQLKILKLNRESK